jgi:hypothetical protein
MPKTLGISPKLAAAVAPPLTAVVTHMILTGKIDRASLALLAAILIGAALGYHAPGLTDTFDVDEPAIDTRVVPDPPDA